MKAKALKEALGNDRQHRVGYLCPRYPQPLQAENRRGGVGSMYGAYSKVPCARKIQSCLGRYFVADLPHKEHIRVLAHGGLEQRLKCRPGFVVHLLLVRVGYTEFYRVLDRDKAAPLGVHI